MDRTREARRATMASVASTHGGLSRRRHRSNSLRDSPEDDGPVEIQETTRLRDRKKDRDRERERERERERDRERDRERERERERDRLSRTSKRRRGDRLVSNREDGADESSEESVNDDEDDEDGAVRMIPPNHNNVTSGLLSNHNQPHQHQHRKSFPVPVKVIRTTTPPSVPPMTTATTTSSTWKAADEMIGVSVPRKARSASTKRSHEWASGGASVVVGVVGEHINRQASTSPVRPSPAPVPAPNSPSSSNASMRKKMKPSGPKQRPPKSSSKSSSSAQEEIEMEIAEVLYGLMRQPQVPSKQDVNGNESVKFDTREVNNKHNNDAKSRVSSPISHSPSILPQPSSILPSNSTSSATPVSAIAPKRKRPRAVKYEDETTTIAPPPSIFPPMNNSVSSTTTKVEIDQSTKIEVNNGSVAENGDTSYLMNSSQAVPASSELDQAEPMKEEKEKSNLVPDSKPSTEESESRDTGTCKKEESQSSMKETSPSPANNPPSTGLRLGDDRDNSTACEIESQREDKLQIDLMSMPPSRSSPERDDKIDLGASDPKPVVTNMELVEIKSSVKEDDKRVKFGKEDVNVEATDSKKPKSITEEAELHNPVLNSERNTNLQLDLEKSDRDSDTGTVSTNKFNHHVQKPHPHQHADIEKSAQSSALPLPMSLASWPGGLPPMGYMAPLQGVVSMDGSAVSSAPIQPPHLLFNQPRPKRCSTHCYIARNVHYHQQFMKMNPFWPAAPGSASLYAPKTNLNIVPPAELNGTIPGKAVNPVQDKGQGLAIFPGHVGKDKCSQAASNMVDTAQRKQIMLQQALPPGTTSNILHGPAFIFPLNQQQQAAAASVRPGSVKSPGASSTTLATSNSASVSATPAGASAPPGMSFNYANMQGNETQYLAILQNNAYPYPFPAHVGAPPGYRGNHAQPMPFIPGSFYSSQMLHPSQLQQQQQPPTQLQQNQQGHQNTSMSSGGSSSQKHLQNLQQRPHGSGVGNGSGNLQVFPAPKNQSPHHMQQLQQRQQQPSQHASHQPRHVEGELGSKDSPSTADSRVSRANMNIYGQNFAIPPNFTLMTAASLGGSASSGGNHVEKKQHNQQPGSKGGAEPHTSQSFAMSFASMNGTTAPTLDMSSFARDHAILQSLPESTRQGYQQMMAAAVAAQTAQQKKNNYHASEEGNHGTNDASNMEEGRNAMAGKISATAGQSIAFSRPDLSDSSASPIPGSNVIDSSARTINLGSAAARNSGSVMPASVGGVNSPSAQQQLQRNLQHQQQQQHQQHQQQQMLQLQKSHQFGTASRSKMPATSNGSAYSDHLPSSSMAAKFPNAMSAFPQNMVQTSSSPGQSPQWKNSTRTPASQVSSPALSSSTSSTPKNISQQQARQQQSHTEISFAANPKSTQSQQPPSSTSSPSPPMVVGSPTSSVSRSAGGSPRTTGSTSTGNKACQASSLSSQQNKNSPSGPSQMSSPVGGRNVPSVLGNPHLSSSSNIGTKPQMVLQQQQQQQQQHQKHAMHPAQQLFFSPAYMQSQAQHSPNSAAASGYFLQRHRNEQQQQAQPQGSSTTSTSMLSLCSPVSLANSGATDPAKAAAGNTKGQGHVHEAQFANTQSSGKPYQLVPGFPYVHAVPAAVQVKPAEQKQPAAGE